MGREAAQVQQVNLPIITNASGTNNNAGNVRTSKNGRDVRI